MYYKRGETNVRTEFSAEVLRERRLNVFFFYYFFCSFLILSSFLASSFCLFFCFLFDEEKIRILEIRTLFLFLSYIRSFWSFFLSLSHTRTYRHTYSFSPLRSEFFSFTPALFLVLSLPLNLIFRGNKFGRLPLIN